MTHFQDEGHYQEHMNAQAQAEYDAMMQEQHGQAESEMPQSPPATRELTFGEKLVGLTFNPSGDAKVQRAKELCSELADLLNRDYLDKESSAMQSRLFNHAICEILNAQMNVVKVLTYKD